MKILTSVIFLTTLLTFSFAQAEVSQQFIRDNALKIKSVSNPPRLIAKQIKGFKVITVGEMHGTNETPQFVLGLVRLLAKKNKSIVLGLEIPHGEQINIDRFVETGDLSILKNAPFFTRDFQDGRSSKAMAALLTKVRKFKNVKVFCFDPAPDDISGQDRDTKMAVGLRKALVEMNPDVMLVLAGNIHASLAVGTPWDPQYKPMGYELYSLPDSPISQSEILAIRLRYIMGSAWVCYTSKPCGKNDMTEPKNNYSEALPWNNYFLKEPDITNGYNATFFARSISASAPLILSP